jgi:DNA-binding NtrC family response regulator
MKRPVVTLAVYDKDKDYWLGLSVSVKKILGPMELAKEADILHNRITRKIDLFLIDPTNVADLASLSSAIKLFHPESKIIVMSYSPTWKQAREAFYCGAVDYIKISTDHTEMIQMLIAGLKKGNSHKIR